MLTFTSYTMAGAITRLQVQINAHTHIAIGFKPCFHVRFSKVILI